MRVVLDTNILARATPGRDSPARRVLLRVIEPPHLLVLSPFLLTELAQVLRYERVQRIHRLDDEKLNHFLTQLQSDALIVPLPHAPSDAVVPSDPEDDPVIATAVRGQAQVICTLDRHFQHPDVQTYCADEGNRTLTEVELLALFLEDEGQ